MGARSIGPQKRPGKKKTVILPRSFYTRVDVVSIARELLGKWLFTKIGNSPITGGIIVETEAYAGAQDKASHAYGNRRTKRTEVMFHEGGVSYVYLCYGIHSLLNVVTHREGIPHAVLIRSIIPKIGIDVIAQRRKGNLPLASGPGMLCQALGITREHNALDLTQPPIWIEDRGDIPSEIISTPRIGIEYAQEDALLPWRFICLEN